jgi:putative transposase
VKRVPPSERTKEAIRALLEGGTEAEDPKSELVRLGIRRLAEEALEAAVRDLLGRGYYERRSGEEAGYRNGYRTGRLKTSEGKVEYAVPQVREVDGEELAALRARLVGRTEELERLGLEMFARGCSTRDIEEIFRGPDGRSLLSRTAVSEVTEALWEEYEEFATRDLSEVRPLYLFVDGIAERLRPGSPREAVLAAWCITWEGKKVLIHLAPGTKESTECCRGFFEDLKRRGLADPVLVGTDGAPGLIRAAEECFPSALRQRCLAHRMRNIVSKLPEEGMDEFKQAARAAYEAPSVAMAQALRQDLVARYGKRYPAAVACFEEDFEACIAHLQCPPAHRRIIRTTNLLERLFGEERRRVDAARTMFGERAVLKLMYAALIRASEKWRGITITEFERAQLERLHNQIQEEHRQRNAPAVKPKGKSRSTPSRFSSKDRT